MKWSIEFATGIDRIDDQHRMLFSFSEDFKAALDEGAGERTYGTLLDSLAVYARAHFGFEEGCMERFRCPIAKQNMQAHEVFLEALTGFKERYALRGFNRMEAIRLVAFIDSWLAGHICSIDVQIKPYVTPIGS